MAHSEAYASVNIEQRHSASSQHTQHSVNDVYRFALLLHGVVAVVAATSHEPWIEPIAVLCTHTTSRSRCSSSGSGDDNGGGSTVAQTQIEHFSFFESVESYQLARTVAFATYFFTSSISFWFFTFSTENQQFVCWFFDFFFFRFFSVWKYSFDSFHLSCGACMRVECWFTK